LHRCLNPQTDLLRCWMMDSLEKAFTSLHMLIMRKICLRNVTPLSIHTSFLRLQNVLLQSSCIESDVDEQDLAWRSFHLW
jgi:hypothetical protein